MLEVSFAAHLDILEYYKHEIKADKNSSAILASYVAIASNSLPKTIPRDTRILNTIKSPFF